MAQQVQIVQRFSSSMEDGIISVERFIFSKESTKQQIVKFLRNEFEEMLDGYSEMTSNELDSMLDVARFHNHSFNKEKVVWAIMDNENSDFYDIFVLSVKDVICFEGNQDVK